MSWKLVNPVDGMKIVARMLFVKAEFEIGVMPDEMKVESIAIDQTSCELPGGITEALLVSSLDNTSSWINSQKFTIAVETK